MNKKHVFIALNIALLMATGSVARAHDASLHKGKPTVGEVVSAEGKNLKVKTDSGVKTVTTTENTKVEVDDQPGNVGELKVGDRLAVFGTTLESGEIVAKEIVRDSGSHHERGEPTGH